VIRFNTDVKAFLLFLSTLEAILRYLIAVIMCGFILTGIVIIKSKPCPVEACPSCPTPASTITPKPSQTIEPPEPTAEPVEPTPAFAKRVSGAGLLFIVAHEGFRNDMYSDSAGHCTVGYGHLIHLGKCTSNSWPSFLSRDQAWELFKTDIQVFEFDVWRNLDTYLPQHRFDSVVSLAYNMGWAALERTGIPRMIDSGQIDMVPAAIRKASCCVTGLQARREDEARLWEDGIYSSP